MLGNVDIMLLVTLQKWNYKPEVMDLQKKRRQKKQKEKWESNYWGS